MTRRRWWTVVTLVVIAVTVVAGLLWPTSAIQVDIATVTRGTIAVTVDNEGRTRLRDRYVVAAPVAGRVARITVLEGHRVEKGDLLTSISPSPSDPRAVAISRGQLGAANARRADAAAQVQSARALNEQANLELNRTAGLTKAGVLSESALEQARLAVTSAGKDLESKQAALRAAEADASAAQAALIGTNPEATGGVAVSVLAPTAGRVLRVLQQSARVVDAGTPLIEIGSATGLEAVVDVLSEDAVQIKPDDPVRIDQWGGDSILHGKVRDVEPDAFTKVSALGVEEQRVNVIVALGDPPPSLGVGYRLQAHIVTWTGDHVLSVPTSALFQRDADWAVFVVQDGRARRRNVRLGHRSTDAAEVLEGLSEGDRVILYPSALITDGARVK